jgi:hypothetical protein
LAELLRRIVGPAGNLQLDPIEDLLATFRRGEISSYESLVTRR